MAVGRISGPLLKDNLQRNGQNLAFETNLLYLDVNNFRVGVNNASPQYDLDVNGTIQTTNLNSTTNANIATFTFNGNTISSTNTTINLTPTGASGVVYQGTISVGSLSISTNVIASTGTNTNINVSPTGTGAVNLNANTLVNGNLHATGVITADGNITLGTSTSNTITFTGEVNSNIWPSATNTYNLGSASLYWNNIYVNTVNATNYNVSTINATTITTSNLSISGNTISSISTNSNINLTPNGTGSVVLGNYSFNGNVITDTSSGAVSSFSSTGNGYYQFTGTYGVVLPVGNTSNRPSSLQTGMIRYNTDQQVVEVYNGAAWGSVAGTLSGITSSQANDIGIEMVLIFG